MNKSLLIISLFLIAVDTGFAQSDPDSLIISGIPALSNSLYSSFDKQLNSYFLNSGINYTKNFSNIELSISENFRSSLFKSETQTVRDEQYFLFTGKYSLSDSYKLGITANSTILSDDRNTLINKSTINYLTLFSEIDIFNNLRITPFGGYTNNIQTGEEDTGPVYGVDGLINGYSGDDFILNANLKFRNEDILPRRNLLRYFNASLKNNFSKDVSNNIIGIYSTSRKDFYFPSDSVTSAAFNIVNNIESRTESNYVVNDAMSYLDIIENIDMQLSATINYRTIDRDKRYKFLFSQSGNIFDTKIEELTLGLGTTMFYRSSLFNGSLSFSFAERDEKHGAKYINGADEFFFESRSEQEARKNNNSGRATIAFVGDLRISGSDNIITSIYFNKLKYDTPSEDNDDDRDEILSIFKLLYSKRFSYYFQAFVSGEATISHIVYLFASRSSNNNINRVFRLKTGGYYSGAKVSSFNTFEVSANYTVYDFENVSSNLRSLSFRQFSATDSSRISLFKNFSFVINGYIKLSEQADLNWSDFSEKPSRYLREIFADPKIVFHPLPASFGFGLRYFSLKTYNYINLSRVPDTYYQSIGPIIEISYNIINSIRLKINCWYEFITINNNPDNERLNLVMDLYWNL